MPQGHHLHALLPGGLKVLSSLYPAFAQELAQRGATEVTLGRDVVWYLPDGKAYSPTGSIRTPFDSGLRAYCASRALIEFAARRQTAAITNIRLEGGSAVRELIHEEGRVQGVRLTDSRTVEADLVVDATGRGRRARHWLTAMGYSPPDETAIGLDTAYSTANFRRPRSFDGEPIIFINGPAPQYTRRGYVITIENVAAIEIPGQNAMLVAITVNFQNTGEKPFWIHDVKGKLKLQEMYPAGTCGAGFAAYLRDQFEAYARVIREADIKAD